MTSFNAKTYENMLEEFHRKYGHYISDYPTVDIPSSIKALRLRLINEEYIELVEGIQSNNLKDIADGAADLIYVVIGTCVSYGIPINRIFAEVHRSNMTKTPVKAAEGEKYGTQNPKGPDYMPPDIDGILRYPRLMTELEAKAKSK